MNETERRIRALELAIEAARNGARSCSILDDAKAFLEFISDRNPLPQEISLRRSPF